MRSILCLALLCVIPVLCLADTIHVPGDYPTIQGAINAAINGDTVLVDAGTYVQNIDFIGKAITVTSEHGPELTVIDGNELGSVCKFVFGEGIDSVLEGFTLQNGTGTEDGVWSWGGGIFCKNSGPLIRGNIIVHNSAEDVGGGIGCLTSHPVIEGNRIEFNSVHFYGGGIGCDDSPSEIRNNTVLNNTANVFGGGICNRDGDSMIAENRISGNSADCGGGICCYCFDNPPQPATIRENKIFDNTADTSGGGIYCGRVPWIAVVNNEIFRNTVSGGALCDGGGLSISGTNFGKVVNNLIYDNHVEADIVWDRMGGGGISFFYNPPKILNNVIVGNTTNSYGGGILKPEPIPPLDRNSMIANNIIWGNSAAVEPSVYPADLTVQYCNVEGGYAGAGNIDADPQFVDATNHDYHLLYTSPCRDAGTNSYIGGMTEDFEGDIRINYGTVDMGADEFATHFYCTGDFSPGGAIEGKWVGLPDSTPTALLIGTAVLDPPIHHGLGDFYLDDPWLYIPLGVAIPAGGVLKIPAHLPAVPPPMFAMQALIGWELSNLFVLEVD